MVREKIDKKYMIDSRNRVTLPGEVLDNLGWHPNDTCRFYCDMEKKEVIIKRLVYTEE